MKTYIIAEAGVNHNGSIEMACDLIRVASEAGADAVKFQTFNTNMLVSKTAPKAKYQLDKTPSNQTQFEMLKSLELDYEDYRILIEQCEKNNIDFLSTPFDTESLNILVKEFNMSKIKISSGEITNAPLLLKAASYNKPIILSTGMCTLGEIENALAVLAFGYLGYQEKPSMEAFMHAFFSEKGQQVLRKNVTLLHCTTEYPASFEEVNLRAMDIIRNAYGLPVGYSDHTEGIAISIAAVALGAVIVEKHFTLNKNLPGPDHKASLEPSELKRMIEGIRQTEAALGKTPKMPTPSELENRDLIRKSLVAKCDIKKGEAFSNKNIAIKRPGGGLTPYYYWDMLGRKAKKDYKKDDLLSL